MWASQSSQMISLAYGTIAISTLALEVWLAKEMKDSLLFQKEQITTSYFCKHLKRHGAIWNLWKFASQFPRQLPVGNPMEEINRGKVVSDGFFQGLATVLRRVQVMDFKVQTFSCQSLQGLVDGLRRWNTFCQVAECLDDFITPGLFCAKNPQQSYRPMCVGATERICNEQ